MAIKTYTDQLESVQTIIATIEAGSQSTSYNGRTVTRADLAALYEREQWLRTKVDQENAQLSGTGRNRVRYVVPE